MNNRAIYILLYFLACLAYQCTNVPDGQQLAMNYCGSCHLYPEPELLPTYVWEDEILPRMGAWLGRGDKELLLNEISGFGTFPPKEILAKIPQAPLLSSDEWGEIRQFYLSNSPEELSVPIDTILGKSLDSIFSFIPFPLSADRELAENLSISYSPNDRLLVGERSGRVKIYNKDLQLQSTSQEGEAISSFYASTSHDLVLSMGNIMPNNYALGKVLDRKSGQRVIDNLYRPVHVNGGDINGDDLEDIIVCEFGFQLGRLSWYELINGEAVGHTILNQEGFVKTIIEDLDEDGDNDILALATQGKETLFHCENKGKGDFLVKTCLSFPPVYGSTDFAYVDLNHDGEKELIFLQGDNADYSPILKPYHGVRIFQGNLSDGYEEIVFLHLNGATGLEVFDADLDGDMDLAFICNFANFEEDESQGFVLLEQTAPFQFQKRTSPHTKLGRWINLLAFDLEKDGDKDLILISQAVPVSVSDSVFQYWKSKRTDFLLLKNNTVKS